jgi:hypothetical protein
MTVTIIGTHQQSFIKNTNAFFRILEKTYSNSEKIIGEITFKYWKNTISVK